MKRTTRQQAIAACRILGIEPWTDAWKRALARAQKVATKATGRKVKRKPRIVRDLGNDPQGFSIQGVPWGGQSYNDMAFNLTANGVPAERFRRSYSPYVGHNAVEVHKKWAKRAARILFGR